MSLRVDIVSLRSMARSGLCSCPSIPPGTTYSSVSSAASWSWRGLEMMSPCANIGLGEKARGRHYWRRPTMNWCHLRYLAREQSRRPRRILRRSCRAKRCPPILSIAHTKVTECSMTEVVRILARTWSARDANVGIGRRAGTSVR